MRACVRACVRKLMNQVEEQDTRLHAVRWGASRRGVAGAARVDACVYEPRGDDQVEDACVHRVHACLRACACLRAWMPACLRMCVPEIFAKPKLESSTFSGLKSRCMCWMLSR